MNAKYIFSPRPKQVAQVGTSSSQIHPIKSDYGERNIEVNPRSIFLPIYLEVSHKFVLDCVKQTRDMHKLFTYEGVKSVRFIVKCCFQPSFHYYKHVIALNEDYRQQLMKKMITYTILLFFLFNGKVCPKFEHVHFSL